MSETNNIKQTGQVFTPKNIVSKMIDLISIKNPTILEPSSGKGVFYYELKKQFSNIKPIEIDKNIAHKGAIIGDFFDDDGEYDVIIGNPPYIEYKEINKQTLSKIKNSQLIHTPNLYMYFLEKSLNQLKEDGELIFVIPTTWISASSTKKLIGEIGSRFSIQHFETLPENIWENASVTTAIIKIKKGSDHKKLPYYISSNKKIIMGERPKIEVKGLVTVKVGGATGNNKKYRNSGRNSTLFVVSSTERTKKLVPMLYYPFIKEWTRKVPTPPKFKYQIFVNAKTRKTKPFFMIDQKPNTPILYDASVISIYCNMSLKDSTKLKNDLNKLNWAKMGILENGRHHFSQSILKAILKG